MYRNTSDRNHVEPHMASRKRLIQLIEMHDLVDVWRNFHKTHIDSILGVIHTIICCLWQGWTDFMV